VSGTVADGKAKVTNIEVTDGGKSTSYGAVDEAPEAARDTVRSIIRLAEADGARKE
jgi:hypothetical protein